MRLEIEVPQHRAEAAAAVPWRIGAQGVAVRDEATGEAPPGRVIICAWVSTAEAEMMRREAERHLGPLRGEARLRLVPEDPRGWQAGLRDAVTVGAFEVVPDLDGSPELDDGPPAGAARRGDDRRLLIEPGSAFGDGAHPTTALCVRAIEACFASGPPGRVLDVGTGTGILALVAAALGARVVGTDIDPLARRAAARHARRNGLADRIRIAPAPPDGLFDLVVANLYLDPLIALAPTLAARIAPGGRCVVSGITTRHRARIERAFAAVGSRPVGCAALDDWIALQFGAPSGATCEAPRAGEST